MRSRFEANRAAYREQLAPVLHAEAADDFLDRLEGWLEDHASGRLAWVDSEIDLTDADNIAAVALTAERLKGKARETQLDQLRAATNTLKRRIDGADAYTRFLAGGMDVIRPLRELLDAVQENLRDVEYVATEAEPDSGGHPHRPLVHTVKRILWDFQQIRRGAVPIATLPDDNGLKLAFDVTWLALRDLGIDPGKHGKANLFAQATGFTYPD